MRFDRRGSGRGGAETHGARRVLRGVVEHEVRVVTDLAGGGDEQGGQVDGRRLGCRRPGDDDADGIAGDGDVGALGELGHVSILTCRGVPLADDGRRRGRLGRRHTDIREGMRCSTIPISTNRPARPSSRARLVLSRRVMTRSTSVRVSGRASTCPVRARSSPMTSSRITRVVSSAPCGASRIRSPRARCRQRRPTSSRTSRRSRRGFRRLTTSPRRCR